jgi:hypothetical protein
MPKPLRHTVGRGSASVAGVTAAVDRAEAHFMLVLKLAEGVTLEEAIESEGDEGTIDGEWETNLAAAGGDEEVITFDVEPGNYALPCFLPSSDGTPHADLGMQHEFTVRGPRPSRAGAPAGKCDLTAGRSPRWRHTSPTTRAGTPARGGVTSQCLARAR